MKRFVRWSFLLVLLSACSDEKDVDFPDDKLVLRYNESAGISYLDPAKATRFEDGWALSQLYNGLVQLDNNLGIAPCIAKDWKVSEEGTVYTFYLRNDVYFHDDDVFKDGKGRKVIASDFLNSFYRICNPETASPSRYIFQQVNTEQNGTIHGFQVINDSTFAIHLKQPQSDFLMKLTLPFCGVVPIEAVDEYGTDFFKHPVGTGPFAFKLWQQDVKLVLVKNENYFEKDAEGINYPYVDAVSVSFMKDKNIEVGEFKKGKLEFISGFHPSIQTNLLGTNGNLKPELEGDFNLLRQPWLKTDYIGILVDPGLPQTKESILRSREIRKAIGYAIDRKSMVRYFRSGIGIPAESGFIPQGMPGHNSIKIEGFTYNPEKAKELLFESGLIFENEKTEVEIHALREYKELCEYLKKELEEIGIEVTIVIEPASVFNMNIAVFNSTFYRKSWTADYPDALNFLQLFYSKNHSPAGPNYTHFTSTYFDNLYEQALTSTDKVQRLKLFHEMEQIIFDEVPVIPLFYDESIRICQNYVSGLETNATNTLDLKKVKLKKRTK